jgi:hypothetical protein
MTLSRFDNFSCRYAFTSTYDYPGHQESQEARLLVKIWAFLINNAYN